jgi:hypothetical protein
VTEAKRRRAAALVKNGVSVSLAHNAITEKAADNPSPFEHTMNRNPGFFMDTYKVSYHGYAHAEVNTEKGCTRLGVRTPAVVTTPAWARPLAARGCRLS